MEEEYDRLLSVPHFQISARRLRPGSPPLVKCHPHLPSTFVEFKHYDEHRWINVSLDDNHQQSVFTEVRRRRIPSIMPQQRALFHCHHFATAQSQDGVYARLSAMISALWLHPHPPDFSDALINGVIQLARKKTLPYPGVRTLLTVDITEATVHGRYEDALLMAAAARSAEDFTMVPAAAASVEALMATEKVAAVGDESCVICLDEFSSGTGATRMPCYHAFHAGCIAEWLMRSHYCPVCRFEMPT